MKRTTTTMRVAIGLAAALAGMCVTDRAFADTTYADPAGDSRGVPDITQLVVSNDTAGTLTFRLTTVAPLVNGSLAFIDLDTDANPATGKYGAEYSLYSGLGGFGVVKWDGAQWIKATVTSFASSISGNVVEFRIGRQDLGVTETIGVSAAFVVWDSAGAFVGSDLAPDAGEWIYFLTFPQCSNGKDDDGDGKADGQDLGCSTPTDDLESDDPVTLKPGKATSRPLSAAIGKAVVVSAPVTRVETGSGIASGMVTCVARAGTKTLKSVGRVVPGRASCRFVVPPMQAKLVRGTMSVTVMGRRVTIPFSFRVH